MRSAKTQISLRRCAGWSESSLPACRRFGYLATHRVPCEDSNQTARMRRLLSLPWANRQSCRKCFVPAQKVLTLNNPWGTGINIILSGNLGLLVLIFYFTECSWKREALGHRARFFFDLYLQDDNFIILYKFGQHITGPSILPCMFSIELFHYHHRKHSMPFSF